MLFCALLSHPIFFSPLCAFSDLLIDFMIFCCPSCVPTVYVTHFEGLFCNPRFVLWAMGADDVQWCCFFHGFVKGSCQLQRPHQSSNCGSKGLTDVWVSQAFKIELNPAVLWVQDFFQPHLDVHHHQITITPNISPWECPCICSADARLETVMNQYIVNQVVMDSISCNFIARMPPNIFPDFQCPTGISVVLNDEDVRLANFSISSSS